MAATTIEWADFSFNAWRGCLKIAPGCKFCYAEKLVNGRMQGDFSNKRIKLADAGWREPLKWNRQAAEYVRLLEDDQHGRADPVEVGCRRPRVFCASLADVFEDWPGPVMSHRGKQLWHTDTPGYVEAENSYFKPVCLDDLRRDLFALIDATPNLDWLILTKRPENIRRMWPSSTRQSTAAAKTLGLSGEQGRAFMDAQPDALRPRDCRPNVWLGCSVSDQATADAAIPELLKCRDLAPVLFVSYEPALGPVDFTRIETWNPACHQYNAIAGVGEDGLAQVRAWANGPRIDWIIVGGESGPKARPFNVAWARSTIEQCKAAGVACFVKQLGSRPGLNPFDHKDADSCILGIKDKKGGDWSEWPEALRVREFPNVAV